MILARNSVIVTENIEKQRTEYYVSKSPSTPELDGIGIPVAPSSLSDGDYVHEQIHYWHTDGTETYGDWTTSYLFSSVTDIQNTVSQIVEKDSDGKWSIKDEILSNTFVYEPLRDENGEIVYDDNGNLVADQNKPISMSNSLMEVYKTTDGIKQTVSDTFTSFGNELSGMQEAISKNTSTIEQNSNYIGLLVDTTHGSSSLSLKDGFISALATEGILFESNEDIAFISKGAVFKTDLSTSGNTTINGDNITTGFIKSKGYQYTSGNFSDSGIAFDLENSSIISKNFLLNNDGLFLANGIININNLSNEAQDRLKRYGNRNYILNSQTMSSGIIS